MESKEEPEAINNGANISIQISSSDHAVTNTMPEEVHVGELLQESSIEAHDELLALDELFSTFHDMLISAQSQKPLTFENLRSLLDQFSNQYIEYQSKTDLSLFHTKSRIMTWLKGGAYGIICTICPEDFQIGSKVCTLQCAHQFHECCMLEWFLDKSSCPTCRADISREELFLLMFTLLSSKTCLV